VMMYDSAKDWKIPITQVIIAPRLATVGSPIQKIGEEAFHALLETLRGGPSVNRVLEHQVIEGETV